MNRLLLFPAIIIAGLAPAIAQQPAPGAARPAPVAPPNPAMEAAQAAFDALPEATRKQIQADLIWASNFTATTSGSFGARTYQAIMNFQRLARLPTTGALDDNQRRMLADVATRARATARVSVQADPRTGASLPVSAALFPRRETLPTGTRWESADGSVVLETGVGQGGAEQLPAAFDRFINVPTPGRRVTYKLLRPDFFVVSGEIGPRSFYVRYAVGPNNLRGYALSYPTARTGELERHVIDIANGFKAVPGAPAPAVAGVTGTPPVASQPTAPPPPNPNTIAPGLLLTGIVVAPGRVATAPLAAACTDLRVAGKPARLAAPGSNSEPAILETDTGTAKPLSAPLAAGSADRVVVLGFSPGVRPALNISNGEAVTVGQATRIAVPMYREGGGSLVLDRRGNVVGMLDAPRQAPRIVAGLVPAFSHAAFAARTVLPQGGTTAGIRPEASAGSLAASVSASLVPITCGQPVTLPK